MRRPAIAVRKRFAGRLLRRARQTRESGSDLPCTPRRGEAGSVGKRRVGSVKKKPCARLEGCVNKLGSVYNRDRHGRSPVFGRRAVYPRSDALGPERGCCTLAQRRQRAKAAGGKTSQGASGEGAGRERRASGAERSVGLGSGGDPPAFTRSIFAVQDRPKLPGRTPDGPSGLLARHRRPSGRRSDAR